MISFGSGVGILVFSETSWNHALIFSNMSCNIILKEVLIVHEFKILERNVYLIFA